MKLEKNYEPKNFEQEIYQNWLLKKYFKSEVDYSKKPFTIIMPPPNITSVLHMGHAFQQTIQDILIRRKRMQGYNALWIPGSDHAAIATEAKVVEKLKKEGLSKYDIGREKFNEEVQKWYTKYKGAIIDQFKMMGYSCDWDRLCFTMDEKRTKAVREVFVKLYKKGYIYRGNRIVNWCPVCNTSISDAEVEYKENLTHLWHIEYKSEDGKSGIVVATTRPETMLGDTAVAVNPKDGRYSSMVGKNVVLPILNKLIPVVADEYVDMEFGTGVVKITPAHDINDFEVGKRHNLEVITVIGKDGKMNDNAGKYCGQTVLDARANIVDELKKIGALVKIENYKNNVGHCERCHHQIESLVSEQWFVKMAELAKPAIEVVKSDKVKFVQERYKRSYLYWMENIKDWCISRQLWSGHKIPIQYCQECGEIIVESEDAVTCPKCGSKNLISDNDKLDTWFSSALWPFTTLGWPDNKKDLDYYYPTDVMVTDRGIINLWVARMIFTGLEFANDIPFKYVLINGTVCDESGKKMSKSAGNGIDPTLLIEKYGVDATRHSVLNGVAIDVDCKVSEKKVEMSSFFLNKLWNLAKFVQINTDGCKVKSIDDVELNVVDKWILHKLNSTIKTVNGNFDKFKLGTALTNIDNFILGDFCDYYIEFAKARLFAGQKDSANAVICYCMDKLLKLIHPFVPMITEKIYQNIDIVGKDESIMISKFPEYAKQLNHIKEYKFIEQVIELIKDIRNLKKSQNIPDNKYVDIIIASERYKELNSIVLEISKLAGIKSLVINSTVNKTDLKNYAYSLSNLGEIYLILEDVDINVQIEKLKVDIEKISFEIQRSEKMLSNVSFVEKAPKSLVDAEKEKLVNNKNTLIILNQKLNNLQIK